MSKKETDRQYEILESLDATPLCGGKCDAADCDACFAKAVREADRLKTARERAGRE